MRWFNTTDNPDPEVPALNELQKPSTTETKEEKSGLMDILSDPKVQEVGSKVIKLGSQIASATSSNVTRQERINKCGKRPLATGLFSKKKRAEIDAYNKCVADANKSMPTTDKSFTSNAPSSGGGANNMTYIVIGAIAVIGGIAYFALKKK